MTIYRSVRRLAIAFIYECNCAGLTTHYIAGTSVTVEPFVGSDDAAQVFPITRVHGTDYIDVAETAAN